MFRIKMLEYVFLPLAAMNIVDHIFVDNMESDYSDVSWFLSIPDGFRRCPWVHRDEAMGAFTHAK